MKTKDLSKVIKRVEASDFRCSKLLRKDIANDLHALNTLSKQNHHTIIGLIDMYKHIQKIPKSERDVIIMSQRSGHNFHKEAKKYGISNQEADFIVASKDDADNYINRYLHPEHTSSLGDIVRKNIKEHTAK